MTGTNPRGKESYREKGEMAKNSGKREKLMQKVGGKGRFIPGSGG